MSSCCCAVPEREVGLGDMPSPASTGFDQLLSSLAAAHDAEVHILRSEIAQLRSDRTYAPCLDNMAEGSTNEPHQGTPHSVMSGSMMSRNTSLVNNHSEVGGPVLSTQTTQSRRSRSNSVTSRRKRREAETSEQPKVDDTGQQTPSSAANRGSQIHRIANMDLSEDQTSLERFLNGPLDIFMSIVIVLNAWSFFVQLYFSGLVVGHKIAAEPPAVWAGAEHFFFVFEHIFHGIYIVEFLIRIVLMRWGFFWNSEFSELQKFNCFDAFIVAIGCWDLYMLPLLGISGTSLGFIRVIRLARLSRTLKVIRVLKIFSKLRVLVSTVASSAMALFWSMFLLILLIFISSIFLCQILQPMLLEDNDNLDADMRVHIYKFFGTPPRAFWTMFEVTLGGEGASLFRPIMLHIHWAFSIFFGAYLSIVVFAVICIIQALFLKDTLDMAANDAEMMVQEHLANKKMYMQRLGELFNAADTSGDGVVTLEEFDAVILNPKVHGYLHMLELEVSEVKSLFNMLDNGDGSISYEEFLEGVMRLKGQARSMDVIAVMSDCRKIIDKLDKLADRIERVEENFEDEAECLQEEWDLLQGVNPVAAGYV